MTMPDRAKVIKGLEICTTRPGYCTDCPYKANCVLDSQELMEDALSLLKEQEPMPVKIVRNDYGIKLCLCPGCGGNFNHEYFEGVIYCENCGQAVIWDREVKPHDTDS